MLADAGTGLVLMCQLAAGVWEFDMIQSALTKPEQACLVLACLLAGSTVVIPPHAHAATSHATCKAGGRQRLHAAAHTVQGLSVTLKSSSSCLPTQSVHMQKQLLCCALVDPGVGGRAGMHVQASIWKSS